MRGGGSARYTVSDDVTQVGQKSAPSIKYTVFPSEIGSPHEVQAVLLHPRGVQDSFAVSLCVVIFMLYHLQRRTSVLCGEL